jgi:hypothetical protein
MNINGEWIVIGYTAETSIESVEKETSKINDENLRNFILVSFEECFQHGFMEATFEIMVVLSEKKKNLFKDYKFDDEWVKPAKDELGHFEKKCSIIMEKINELGNEHQKEMIKEKLKYCFEEGRRIGRRQYA